MGVRGKLVKSEPEVPYLQDSSIHGYWSLETSPLAIFYTTIIKVGT